MHLKYSLVCPIGEIGKENAAFRLQCKKSLGSPCFKPSSGMMLACPVLNDLWSCPGYCVH